MNIVKRLVAILPLLIILAGCNHPEEKKNGSIIEVGLPATNPQAHTSPKSASLSSNDKASLASLTAAITKAQTVARELKIMITEAQHDDELDAAQDSIETARQEILYVWNTIHNEIHPESKGLQEQKTEYETLLMEYREGLETMLSGMENGNATQVNGGWERANKAEQKLQPPTGAAATK
jgi:hypothetical protein